MINLFICPTVRSGGSLINRMFDHHPDIAAYPFELFLPMDPALHPSLKNRGQKKNIQNFPHFDPHTSFDVLLPQLLLSRDPSQCLFGSHFGVGELKGKNTFLKIESHFDHSAFIKNFEQSLGSIRTTGAVYNQLHRTFFEHWDQGKHAGSLKYVTYHSGNGLLADIDTFFKEFPDSYCLQPIRSVHGCLSSEKKKIVRQIIGRGRIGRRINLADKRLKLFYGRFIENTLVNWLLTTTRSVILKRRYGNRYLVYRHEDLVKNPQVIMKKLSEAIGVPFYDSLTTPTIAGIPWKGNSMFGSQSGVNTKLSGKRDVFTQNETDLIEEYTAPITAYLKNFENDLIHFDNFDNQWLFDYDYQIAYEKDRQKLALYFASLYERWRYDSVGTYLKNVFHGVSKNFYLT